MRDNLIEQSWRGPGASDANSLVSRSWRQPSPANGTEGLAEKIQAGREELFATRRTAAALATVIESMPEETAEKVRAATTRGELLSALYEAQIEAEDEAAAMDLAMKCARVGITGDELREAVRAGGVKPVLAPFTVARKAAGQQTFTRGEILAMINAVQRDLGEIE